MAIKLLIGGSPCTHWSIAQKNNRETEPSGMGWELFKNYLIAKEKFNPDFFLYENNKSAAQPIKDQIAKELGVGVDPEVRFTYINSALVSAQNRERFYVTNFGDIEQPEDRGIYLEDIVQNDIAHTYLPKDRQEYSNYDKSKVDKLKHPITAIQIGMSKQFGCSTNSRGKAFTLRAACPNGILDADYQIRMFTVTECCRLQTMPDDYCKTVSATQAYKALGNGWTAEVIIHLLNHALKDVPRNEEIVVLSLYDGIGTGRYCLDKMGFTNVKYYTYEIDKYPMAIANDNYPDIIQCGDAFAVREDSWKPPQTCSEWLDELLEVIN
jgi:site-specific DNA-cytosine methylase